MIYKIDLICKSLLGMVVKHRWSDAVGAADCIVAICPKCLLLEWHIFVFAESAVTGVVSISLIFIIISLELNYPIALSQVVNGVLGFYLEVLFAAVTYWPDSYAYSQFPKNNFIL